MDLERSSELCDLVGMWAASVMRNHLRLFLLMDLGIDLRDLPIDLPLIRMVIGSMTPGTFELGLVVTSTRLLPRI